MSLAYIEESKRDGPGKHIVWERSPLVMLNRHESVEMTETSVKTVIKSLRM